MSILDKIEKLKEQMLGFRGELDETTERNLEIWHEQIRENQDLIDLSMSKGMKTLVKEVKRQLSLIDNTVCKSDLPDRERDYLLAQRKAWIDVLQTLIGAPGRLKALEAQIDYELE